MLEIKEIIAAVVLCKLNSYIVNTTNNDVIVINSNIVISANIIIYMCLSIYKF